MGDEAIALGVSSVAFGLSTEASGHYSVAMGRRSAAVGEASVVLGSNALALVAAKGTFIFGDQSTEGTADAPITGFAPNEFPRARRRRRRVLYQPRVERRDCARPERQSMARCRT